MNTEKRAAVSVPGAPRQGVPGWRARLAVVLVSLAACALLGEGLLRLLFHDTLAFRPDERSLFYRHDQRLGWFPVPNRTNQFTASRTITAVHNRRGFRGPELAKSGAPRIMFVGDSFVWGYDVEAAERFTEQLEAKHPEWEVCNAGVSGYGTDQQLLLLEHWFDHFQPAAVVLMFCPETDHEDNCTDCRYEGYYKPYYTIGPGARLELKGVPVPKSERAFYTDHPGLFRWYLVRLFLRVYCRLTRPPALQVPDPTAEILLAMRKLVLEKGARFGVGLEFADPPVARFLDDCRILYVDLTVEEVGPYRYSSFGGHWTPEGHALVTERLDPFLGDLLKTPQAPRGQTVAVTEREMTDALARFHGEVAPFESKGLKPAETIAKYRAALRLLPDFPEALNNLAWLLAVNADPQYRDGPEAVRLARRACELTAYKRPKLLGTLAAAYAEASRFPEAVAAGERAVRLAEASGDFKLKGRNQELLDRYRAGRAYHEQP